MNDIIIYTKDYCPYCTKAKQLFKSKNLEFKEIDVTHDSIAFTEMVNLAGGRKTVPQIFINEQHIGGCDDLYELHQNGKLSDFLV